MFGESSFDTYQMSVMFDEDSLTRPMSLFNPNNMKKIFETSVEVVNLWNDPGSLENLDLEGYSEVLKTMGYLSKE